MERWTGVSVKGKAVSNLRLDAVDGLKEAMLSKDTVADVNEDRGSCSCLEGSACQSEYTCKDWAHRFEIAKRVRGEHAREQKRRQAHRQIMVSYIQIHILLYSTSNQIIPCCALRDHVMVRSRHLLSVLLPIRHGL